MKQKSTIDRRGFFKKSATIIGAASSAAAFANPIKAFGGSDLGLTQKELFDRALKKAPNLIGLKSIEKNYALKELTIEGKLPSNLKGGFYRIGPAKHERAGLRYNHLFEGDGMVHKFSFLSGKITHQGKFIKTPKYLAEEKAGRFLYSGPDTKITGGRSVSNADAINTSNTNVVPIGDDIWTLWEAGSAMRADPNTLESQSFINLGEGTVIPPQISRGFK